MHLTHDAATQVKNRVRFLFAQPDFKSQVEGVFMTGNVSVCEPELVSVCV